MSNEAVCRTAPATPGLLNIYSYNVVIRWSCGNPLHQHPHQNTLPTPQKMPQQKVYVKTGNTSAFI